jgi:hypothetical protein
MQDQNSSQESTGYGAQEVDNRVLPAGLDPTVAAQNV